MPATASASSSSRITTSFLLDGDRWRRLADQPLARGGATAQALGGRVHVVGGGVTERGALRDHFAYDPAADSWARRAPVPTERQHVASCAVGGKMLVLGGWFSETQQVVAAAEVYDPAADAWTAVMQMPTPRGGFAAASLGSTCYAIGGESWHLGDPGTFGANEAFDVMTRAWRRLAPLPVPRHGLGVAALDGSIYVVGGGPIKGNSYSPDVDVFQP